MNAKRNEDGTMCLRAKHFRWGEHDAGNIQSSSKVLGQLEQRTDFELQDEIRFADCRIYTFGSKEHGKSVGDELAKIAAD